MEIISTPIHSIVKDEISSISIGFDNKNPNLFALQIFMKNGNAITTLFATKLLFIEFMKKGIEKDWCSEYKVFDMEVYAQNIVKKAGEELDVVYDFNSVDSLIISINERKKKNDVRQKHEQA